MTPQIKSPSDLFSFSHVRNATRMEDSRLGALRTVSNTGMKATVDEQLYDVKHTPEENAPDRPAPHPRIGIGLPMSNIYATYVLSSASVLLLSEISGFIDISAALLSLLAWTVMVSLICEFSCAKSHVSFQAPMSISVFRDWYDSWIYLNVHLVLTFFFPTGD